VNPKDGEVRVVEMNPRVSRSSALASKATGFPIAKVAAKLAVGLTLDEIPNDITKKTPASFEPTLDYVVVKTPRWDLGKFPDAEPELSTQMKAVCESMAMGRTFEEALQKALKSLDIGVCGLYSKFDELDVDMEELNQNLSEPGPDRIFYLKLALKRGYSVEKVHELTGIDPWFIEKVVNIVAIEEELRKDNKQLTKDQLKKAKTYGFSDEHIASLTQSSEEFVRKLRLKYDITPTYKTVDTCAAEFESYTPYFYSTYEEEDETIECDDEESIMILGSGPNRIGQGIEFDYCCVQSVFALKEMGFRTIMVNSNPETVSTDYDTSDELYFEPLTGEDVLNIIDKEDPLGVIVQFGGQAPLKMADTLEENGVKILGTSPDAIDLTEDRKRFSKLLDKFGIKQPRSGTAQSFEEALTIAKNVGYPVIVRPSYVLGGRGMKIVHQESELERYVTEAAEVSEDKPILIDEYLEDSMEIEVDAVCDGTEVLIGGIMEHIEEAGVHSGDSACVLPPQTVNKTTIDEIKNITKKLAKAIDVIGLMNIQYAVKNHDIYVLEVNPRASRTIPYVSKSTGAPLAKIATKVLLGKSLKGLGVDEEVKSDFISVKNPVFSFSKLPGVNPFIGPEMKATGETMGMDSDFGRAFYKSQIYSNHILPSEGNVYISVKNKDIRIITLIASKLHHLGFNIHSTENTGRSLNNMGIKTQIISEEDVTDMIKSDEISLVINTNVGNGVRSHEFDIVTTAVNYEVPYYTTVAASLAVVNAIETLKLNDISVRSLQDFVTGVVS
ncbi:MAG: carbamoyl-phosphate synthase large subunit, partial [Thermoplasmatota archaeon]